MQPIFFITRAAQDLVGLQFDSLHVILFVHVAQGPVRRDLSPILLRLGLPPIHPPSALYCVPWSPCSARRAPSAPTRSRSRSGTPLETRPLLSVLHTASSSRVRHRGRTR